MAERHKRKQKVERSEQCGRSLCLYWRGVHQSPGHWRLRDAGTGGVDHPWVSREGAEGGERERERARGPQAGAGPGSAQQGGRERNVPRGNGEATL